MRTPIAAHQALGAAVACLASRASLAALTVLLMNDHLLKPVAPSWLTGKLSDVAGLYFAPFLVLAVVLAGLWRLRSPDVTRQSPELLRSIAPTTFGGLGLLVATLNLSYCHTASGRHGREQVAPNSPLF